MRRAGARPSAFSLKILGQSIRKKEDKNAGKNEGKASEKGELLVRGGNVMRGYYQRQDATERAIDADGWLHTGDRGTVDEEGYVTILGRVEEQIKTSTGEWVSPVPIEQNLSRHGLVDHALIIAEGRSYVTCLLFPDSEALMAMKAKYSMSQVSDEEFLESKLVRQAMQRHISQINRHLNEWERVRAYRFVLESLSPESGELTPTLKIRRDLVMKKYKDVIQDMYEKQEAA